MRYDELVWGRRRRESEPFSWGGCVLLVGLSVVTLAWLVLLGWLAVGSLS
jgi:hypothetical protein